MSQNKAIAFISIFSLLLLGFSISAKAQIGELISAYNIDESKESDLNQEDPSNFHDIAIIQALNKITARTSVLAVQMNNGIEFGKLFIIARKCWSSPPDQRPENKILLEIYDTSSIKEHSKENRIFYGWMISSSPSISDLEHPIYDITAISCKR